MVSHCYERIISVEEQHLDALNHVNNVVFLQWVQDMAGEHWNSKPVAAFDDRYYWVVLDHHIHYTGQAFLGDRILAKTYIEKNDGIRSTRIVEFYKDNELIVNAKTHWCLINREKNKPVRIPQEIDNLFFEKIG